MSGSVNKVILVGNLGRDPEVRRMNNGDQVCSLRLATTESWRDKASGERKERTEWHSVVLFNENLVRVAQQYLKKGAKVYVEGQLQTRKWTDQAGVEKYSTEVVLKNFGGELTLLDARGSNDDAERETAEKRSNAGSLDFSKVQRPAPRGGRQSREDSEIPF